MFKKGFTLIELLVVVAIIGLLASVIVVSLGSARQGARDARRAGDIAQIRTALELYASSNSSQYPANIDVGGLDGYIPAVPKDPTGTAYSYCTATPVNGKILGYGLGIALEEEGSGIMAGSVELGAMPVGCQTVADFLPAPGLACEALSATSKNYCVSNG